MGSITVARITKSLLKAREAFQAETIRIIQEHGAMRLGNHGDYTVPTNPLQEIIGG